MLRMNEEFYSKITISIDDDFDLETYLLSSSLLTEGVWLSGRRRMKSHCYNKKENFNFKLNDDENNKIQQHLSQRHSKI